MSPGELHSVVGDHEDVVAVEHSVGPVTSGGSDQPTLGSIDAPGDSDRSADVTAVVRRAVARVWWWVLLPLGRSVVSSSVWAGLSQRTARMLSRGLAQLVAALWLVLGLVVLCGPAVMVTVVGGMVAGTAVLLLWRRAVPVGLAAVALALGAGLLALPEVMVAVTGGVLTLVGAVVLAVPPARAVYAHSERARVRSAYGVDGWAGWWDLHRQLSPHAVRLAAAATRPSVTAEASQLRAGGALAPGLVERLAVRRCETWLGRSVVGPVIGTECYAAHRDVVGLVAPPQTGRRR